MDYAERTADFDTAKLLMAKQRTLVGQAGDHLVKLGAKTI
jgi:hypothetical protein